MQDEQDQSNARAIISTVERLQQPWFIHGTEGIHSEDTIGVVLPAGKQVHSLKKLYDEWRDAPDRRRGTARFEDIDAFIAHTNRFSDESSVVFASTQPAKLVSVLDYHEAGPKGAPRWGQHRGEYAFPFSEEWLRWTGAAGKELGQASFAEFLEKSILDIADPASAGPSALRFANALGASFADAQALMELSRGLTIRVASRVRNAQTLSNGTVQVQYDTEHQNEAGAPINVPQAFLLGIRVFKNGDLYQVPVRLRYRLREEKINWTFELWRSDLVFDDAFAGALERVRQATKIPVLIGTPES